MWYTMQVAYTYGKEKLLDNHLPVTVCHQGRLDYNLCTHCQVQGGLLTKKWTETGNFKAVQ